MNEKIQKDSEILHKNIGEHIPLDPPSRTEGGEEPPFRSEKGSRFHYLSKEAAHALIAALSSGRPLLITGEPGIGKTRLALAAARLLSRRFLKTVVQPQTEYHELLWSFDYTGRLADAQRKKAVIKINDVQRYICPGPLWWALNQTEAEKKQYSRHSYTPDSRYKDDSNLAAAVVLIDEIDKADVNSLALGLLEVLGEEEFFVPPLGEYIRVDGQPPLVIFTSNKTRELPAAFVRRCAVLNLELEDPITDYLIKLGKQHYKWVEDIEQSEQCLEVIEEAAKFIVNDRNASTRLPRSGVAEYIDLLNALSELSDDHTGRLMWLERLGGYFCKSR